MNLQSICKGEFFQTKIKSVKKWGRKIALGAVALLVLTAAYAYQSPATELAKSADATTPRFNFLAGDYEMLRGAQQSDASWSDPVSANIGDRIPVLFYYHNGIVGSVAHHTKLRVDLPMEQSNQLVMTNYLWSQETAAISDTIVNGAIVGQTGLTINLPTSGRVEYVAGSTKWYPNGTTVGTNVPDGVVSTSGLDIGDIQGCWNYAGFITFLVDVKGQAQLVMDKKVAHPGDATWRDEITAIAGDQVAYSVGISNEGNATAEAVTVKDQLPLYMSYETGTTYLYTKEHPEGIKQADTLFSTGLSLPNVVNGADNSVYLTYKTKIDTNIPNENCGWILNNVAKVYMNNVEQDMDQAKVTVICQSKVLFMDKKVQATDGSWVEQSTSTLGATINYKVTVKNNGNVALTNISVRDIMPIYVNYIVGSTKIDGVATNDQLITNTGLSFVSLQPGVTKVITFSGIVFGCPPLGDITLQNTAYAKADSIVEFWDSASTILNTALPVAPGLSN